MEAVKNSRINEQHYRVKHKSGVTVLLYPMKGYSTAYALFGARYGSVDTVFRTGKDNDYTEVPAGIAHYLEHKLFESDECSVFQLYAATGAEANAFTSFDKTAYLFSCSEKFEENLEILLKFVQEPYFTDENVDKERGIIEQEIRMYEDDPGWQVLFGCLEAMYEKNPIRTDIAGTAESIAKIDKELLYRCYDTFYDPSNMVLSIAGNFDTDKALEICDRLLKNSKNPDVRTLVPEEPERVRKKRTVKKMSCAVPIFNIGFKFPDFSGEERSRNFILYTFLTEMCFGDASDFYTEMNENGLINDSFSAFVFCGRGYFTVMASGESRDPDTVLEKMCETLQKAKRDGLSETDFIAVRNRSYGRSVSSFNNVESVAVNMLDSEMSGVSVYDCIETVANVTLKDVADALDRLDTDNCSISVIEPEN